MFFYTLILSFRVFTHTRQHFKRLIKQRCTSLAFLRSEAVVRSVSDELLFCLFLSMGIYGVFIGTPKLKYGIYYDNPTDESARAHEANERSEVDPFTPFRASEALLQRKNGSTSLRSFASRAHALSSVRIIIINPI